MNFSKWSVSRAPSRMLEGAKCFISMRQNCLIAYHALLGALDELPDEWRALLFEWRTVAERPELFCNWVHRVHAAVDRGAFVETPIRDRQLLCRALRSLIDEDTHKAAINCLWHTALAIGETDGPITAHGLRLQPGLNGFNKVHVAERGRQSDLIREIVPNPYWSRFPQIGKPLSGYGAKEVVAVATDIVEYGRWSCTGVLADALEDFGCEDSALLAHLRRPEGHVYGCWAVDLVLGREQYPRHKRAILRPGGDLPDDMAADLTEGGTHAS